jgi:hypothetical protein
VTAERGFYNSDVFVEHYLGLRWPVRVWAAVLEQAKKDAVSGPEAFETRGMAPYTAEAFRAGVQDAARDWIADELNEPRSFVWVCEQLDLDPDAVRRSVGNLKQEV